jgi:predicted nucleic acid-binding protein
MGVLIDTSVWIDHFRNGNDALVELIKLDLALTHPMVIAEIACGTPPAPRIQTLNSLALLIPCKQASLSEVMDFIEREKLYGLGCGLVDMSLLASTLITPGAELWTLDKRLAELAGRFDVANRPPVH